MPKDYQLDGKRETKRGCKIPIYGLRLPKEGFSDDFHAT